MSIGIDIKMKTSFFLNEKNTRVKFRPLKLFFHTRYYSFPSLFFAFSFYSCCLVSMHLFITYMEVGIIYTDTFHLFFFFHSLLRFTGYCVINLTLGHFCMSYLLSLCTLGIKTNKC